MATILPIDQPSVHRITSGQVVTDLQTAIKELVENSIDAGATSVEVRFKDLGMEYIEVIDNGSGINKTDYPSIALKHHTSKLFTFADLSSVSSFGFRGEALSSLCALSESVEVITSTQEEAPLGTVITFDRLGRITSSDKTVARTRGTTILIKNIFQPVPVRRHEFTRNAKREFAKALHLLAAYAFVGCLTENGVRLTVVGLGKGKGSKRTVHLQTTNSTALRSTISSLWGPKAPMEMQSIDLLLELVNAESVNQVYTLKGMISLDGHGRSSPDRQFYSINGRPCSPTKLSKMINEVFRSTNPNQSPVVILDLALPRTACDVNVTADKRTIFLHDENEIVDGFRTKLLDLFSKSSSNSFPIPLPFSTSETPDDCLMSTAGLSRTASLSRLQSQPSILSLLGKKKAQVDLEEDKSDSDVEMNSKAEDMVKDEDDGDEGDDRKEVDSEMSETDPAPPQEDLGLSENEDEPDPPNRALSPSSSSGGPSAHRSHPDEKACETNAEVSPSPTLGSSSSPLREEAVEEEENEEDLPLLKKRKTSDEVGGPKNVDEMADEVEDVPHSLPRQIPEITRSGTLIPPSATVRYSLSALQTYYASRRPPSATPSGEVDKDNPELAISDLKSTEAEADLERIVLKTDFERMEVVGQFNLGFIIARKKASRGDDLFIVDQHAADEKVNFEILQKETKIESQKLLRPRVLELSVVDTVLVQDNLAILRQNGFDLRLSSSEEIAEEEDEEEGEHPSGPSQVSLCAQPVSKHTVFDLQDLEELIHLMRDGPTGQMVRCSKARRMFASRACRKSIMVGKPLTRRQMIKVLRNMGQIDQPWNCPHGRPTMRHLIHLGRPKQEQRPLPPTRTLDWQAFWDDR